MQIANTGDIPEAVRDGTKDKQTGEGHHVSTSRKKGSMSGILCETEACPWGLFPLSLLATFEVFPIIAANGIIDLFGLSKGMAGASDFLLRCGAGGGRNCHIP